MAESMQSKLQKKEDFWRTLLTLGGLAGAAGTAIYFWSLIVPFLIDVATNTIHLVALCAILGGLAYIFLDKRLRTFVSYMYSSATRWLINQFTNIDPIGVLNTYVRRLQDKLAEMDKAIGSLRGQKDELQKAIDNNEEERIKALKQAQQAQKRPDMKNQVALRGRQAGRLQESNMTLAKLLVRITKLHDDLVKMRGAADVTIQDIQAEVDVRTKERKALLAGYKAFKAAQGIYASNDAEREIYDMTLEKLTNDYAEKMGEIETFMDMSKKIVDGVDLDNMVFEEDAIIQLDAWEKGKNKVRVDAGAPVNIGPRIDSVGEEEAPSSFSNLFDSDSKKQNKSQ